MPGRSRVDPLPVLLLRRGNVAARHLATLRSDPRIELFEAKELTPQEVAAAQRMAAVLIATTADPLEALTYVVTAGVSAPVVVAVDARHKHQRRDVVAAGAALCVTMPLAAQQVHTIVKRLSPNAAYARVDRRLRLLLDPIGGVARFQDRITQLSQREFALLHRLSDADGLPVAAQTLLTDVWGDGATEQSRQILDVYIFQLRKKLQQLGLDGTIATVREFGYALTGRDRRVRAPAPPGRRRARTLAASSRAR